MKRRPPGGSNEGPPPRATSIQAELFGPTPPPSRETARVPALPPEKAGPPVEPASPAAVLEEAAKPGGLVEPPRPAAPVEPAPRAPALPARRDYPWRAPVEPAAAPAEQDARARRQVLSVGELTRQIKGTLERGFPRVFVRGEISGFRGPNMKGHLYFTLKDAEACLDAKIWASTAARMKFKLREGMSVVAEGSIDLYEPSGRYSLIIQRLEPAGEGALALAFQQLKERLAAEGLFGEKRSRPVRPIPFLPRRIGVVTSVTGAALQDFLRVLHGRHPRLSVLICDARVQGEGAARDVVSAIARLARTDVDVLVVTRGGGSIEDLWTFNEEAVARALFACPVPVVSAIGHEVDFTIADFVADYRAPTPSAAAEKLAPVLRDLELSLATAGGRLRKAAERAVLMERQHLRQLSARLPDPRRLLAQRRLHLSEQEDRLERGVRQALRSRREQQRGQVERLNRRRPQAELAEHREGLARLKARLLAAARELARQRRQALSRWRIALERASPRSELHRRHKGLGELASRLAALKTRRMQEERRRFAERVATLQALSPLQVMARGYSVTFRRDDGRLVRSAADVKPGDPVAIRLLGSGGTTLSGCDEVHAVVTAVRSPQAT